MGTVPLIRSLGRGLEVLQFVSQAGAVRRSQIKAAINLPYPTINRIVHTLLDEGYLEFEGSRKLIRVTARVQSLAQGFQRYDKLVEIANPVLADLTQKLEWPLTVATRMGSSMIVRASTHEQTPMTFKHYYPGFVFSMLDSASGRVYLAFCSDEEREACLDGIAKTYPNEFDHAITLARQGHELRQIRERGIETSRYHGTQIGTLRNAAMAAPIFDSEGVCGALSLIFFASAMSAEKAVERYAEELKKAAAELSKQFSAGANSA
jgi:IclR family transcriptional regulator, mhp operon transcriptional activator